jgi:hypothetical protein
MKKLLLAIAVASVATAGSAIAYDNNMSAPDTGASASDRSAAPAPRATVPDRDESPSASIPGPQQDMGGARVIAQVLAVHPEAGKVLLATDAGMLALDAPPEDLAPLKAGDHVIVMLPDGNAESGTVLWQ